MSDGQFLLAIAFLLVTAGVILGWLLAVYSGRHQKRRTGLEDQRMIQRIKARTNAPD
jgi:hypothetical protein